MDAQREACEAYIKSQAHEGWGLVPDRYDGGGLSGACLDRPALQKLLLGIAAGSIDVVVVYKVDRLTRSLADFAKLVELFEKSVWIAVGDYMGVTITVQDRSEGAALKRWREAAEHQGN